MSKSLVSFPFIVIRRPLFGDFRPDCSAIEAAVLVLHQKIKLNTEKQSIFLIYNLCNRTKDTVVKVELSLGSYCSYRCFSFIKDITMENTLCL